MEVNFPMAIGLAGGFLNEAEEMAKEAAQTAKQEVIDDLIKAGTILPAQDWGEEFQAKEDAIIADWFNRHPEVQRGTGEFKLKHPQVDEALRMVHKMSTKGRITPEEYLVLCEGLHNF